MIVNKPQFDIDKIKPGQTYWLQKIASNGYYEINTPCIVIKVEPLSMLVAYYAESKTINEGHMKNMHIAIEDVITTKKYEKIVLIAMEKVVIG